MRIARRRPHPIWADPQSPHWWETIVPNFSPQQFVQHFLVSRESFEYICDRLRPALGRRDTNFRFCVPIRKRVAIALWKLATRSAYRTISHCLESASVLCAYVFRRSAARPSRCCFPFTSEPPMLISWWRKPWESTIVVQLMEATFLSWHQMNTHVTTTTGMDGILLFCRQL